MATDGISELPDSILCHILSFVPTKLAATTSILSKRWKFVWLSVLTLEFNDETFKDFHSFTNFMSSVMSSRDITLPIHSFTFNCSNKSSPYDLKDLNRSVNLSVQRGELENLNLHMPLLSTITIQKHRKIELAPCIFSCKTLQVLNLSNFILIDITSHHQLDLPLLKTLHCYGVVFKSISYIIKILSSCPILEELHVSYSRILDYTDPLQTNFKVLPNLAKARIIDLYCPMTLLSETENLHLQTIGVGCYTKLPMFHRLINIDLIYNNRRTTPETSKVVWWIQLLNRCPKLQNITIEDCVDGDQYDMFDKYMKDDQAIVPLCLSSHLKTFCLREYKGTKCELQFLTYIIQNSKVLHTMTITSTPAADINEKRQMLMKLSSSTKGSTTCKLLFD